jgi:UDP-N-acetylglucosamine 4,6-dehydratase/5-epimerase
LKELFENKKILITGGTGSLGKALTKKLLEFNVNTIRIFSRDELKQSEMQSKFNDKRLRFLIGDIRDKERLSRAFEDIDIVFHAAALKQVPVAEYNPFEAVKTNVQGSQNIIDACLDNKIEIAIGIGTDKAVSPLNTYGATKLLMERIFVSANNYRGNRNTKFCCVRYGNVLGSRGSIVPIFVNQIKTNQKITITDPNMTRFNITMDDALNLIFRSVKHGKGGEVFVPKLKAYRVEDMKNSIIELLNANDNSEIINIRPGEKLHEMLINRDEIRSTFENQDDYIIVNNGNEIKNKNSDLAKTSLMDEYSSDKVKLLSKDELKDILIMTNLVN